MSEIDNPALICAFSITKHAATKKLEWCNLNSKPNRNTWHWIHLNRTAEETSQWLCDTVNMPTIISNALLVDETRPGIKEFSDGHVINLRGVNLNPNASDEDMVAIRLWVTKDKIISLRRYKLMAVQDLREKYEMSRGPKSIGGFISELCYKLTERISNTLSSLEDSLDMLEEEGIDKPLAKQRNELMNIRRKAIPLKRFLTPQRSALEELSRLDADWVTEGDREHLRESYHHLSRIIEALDALRERASLLHEEMSNRSAEVANNNTYVLTIVAAIFLPLGFLTGLLGINVGGLPGTENPWAFAIVCILMVAIGLFEVLILKWLKWI